MLFAAALTTLAGLWTAMAAMVAVDFGFTDATRISAQRRWIVIFAVRYVSTIPISSPVRASKTPPPLDP